MSCEYICEFSINDLNKIDSLSGTTAFHLACKKKQYNIAKYLFELGCEVDTRDKFGFTPLMTLCGDADDPEALELFENVLGKLEETGADVNYLELMFVAVEKVQYGLFEELLAKDEQTPVSYLRTRHVLRRFCEIGNEIKNQNCGCVLKTITSDNLK